jgi:hypothetical protein
MCLLHSKNILFVIRIAFKYSVGSNIGDMFRLWLPVTSIPEEPAALVFRKQATKEPCVFTVCVLMPKPMECVEPFNHSHGTVKIQTQMWLYPVCEVVLLIDSRLCSMSQRSSTGCTVTTAISAIVQQLWVSIQTFSSDLWLCHEWKVWYLCYIS